jgi:hypothetical protein
MRITLGSDAKCAECGAELKAGAEVNGGYRNGAVYGLTCHPYRSKGKSKRPGPPVGSRYHSNPSQEDYCCSDRGYEEQCERAYERANGGW